MGLFSKKKPKKRTVPQAKQMGQRQFMAAVKDRTHNWDVMPSGMDQDLKTSLTDMRSLARDLEQNNDYIKRFHGLVKNHVVGSAGAKLQCIFKDKKGQLLTDTNESIEEAFTRWAVRPEVTGRQSWVQVQQLVIGAVARDGEAIVRMVFNSDHNDFKFSLQMIDSAVLDESLNEDYEDGRKIRLGIELDEWDAPVAYYLKTSGTGKNVFNFNGVQYLKVPAKEILHVFRSDRVTQSRGYPWCHTAIRGLKSLEAYIGAEVTAARIGASKMGFFTRQVNAEGQYEGEDLERDEDGNYITQAEPGSFEILPEGVSFSQWNPSHPNQAYKDFVKGILRGIASGLQVSYSSLSSDLESVNFSSIRSGLLEEREHWKTLQSWFIDAFMVPVYQHWIGAAVLSGELKLSAKDIGKYSLPIFLPKRWGWVDPKKETEAAILSINAGLRSRAEIASEQGRSIEDILSELKREEELMSKYKIKNENSPVGENNDDEEEGVNGYAN